MKSRGAIISRGSVLDTTERIPVGAAIVVSGIRAGRIEVQVVGVDTGRRTRPIAAEATLSEERSSEVVTVAGGGQLQRGAICRGVIRNT